MRREGEVETYQVWKFVVCFNNSTGEMLPKSKEKWKNLEDKTTAFRSLNWQFINKSKQDIEQKRNAKTLSILCKMA